PEARIVAVADVYDALSSARHYKSAWDADDYAAELRQQARDGKLDAPCVEALLAEPEACAEIRQRYADPPSPDLARVLAISHADVLGRWPLPLTPSA
ncbi:MAG: hypothetical protein RL722_1647, partial [Pseudomonadota bacterium]